MFAVIREKSVKQMCAVT